LAWQSPTILGFPFLCPTDIPLPWGPSEMMTEVTIRAKCRFSPGMAPHGCKKDRILMVRTPVNISVGAFLCPMPIRWLFRHRNIVHHTVECSYMSGMGQTGCRKARQSLEVVTTLILDIPYGCRTKIPYAIGIPKNGSFVNAGTVRVYNWDGTAWNQKGADFVGTSPQQIGYSVCMPDTNTLAFGGIGDYEWCSTGVVKIYSWNGNNWVQKGDSIVGESASTLSGWPLVCRILIP
jgi:hypothetical protein